MMKNKMQEIWEIYNYSFPESERRDIQSQKRILDNPIYRLQPLCSQNSILGFLAYWDLDAFIFIEHLAIKRGLRGRGYGSRAIKKMVSHYPRIILEVEKPETDVARKRISFYERLGFYLNRYPYLQPPYPPKKRQVPLFLMSFPRKINEQEFRKAKEILYAKVYQKATGQSAADSTTVG